MEKPLVSPHQTFPIACVCNCMLYFPPPGGHPLLKEALEIFSVRWTRKCYHCTGAVTLLDSLHKHLDNITVIDNREWLCNPPIRKKLWYTKAEPDYAQTIDELARYCWSGHLAGGGQPKGVQVNSETVIDVLQKRFSI